MLPVPPSSDAYECRQVPAYAARQNSYPLHAVEILKLKHLYSAAVDLVMFDCCRGCHTNPVRQHTQKRWTTWSSFVIHSHWWHWTCCLDNLLLTKWKWLWQIAAFCVVVYCSNDKRWKPGYYQFNWIVVLVLKRKLRFPVRQISWVSDWLSTVYDFSPWASSATAIATETKFGTKVS